MRYSSAIGLMCVACVASCGRDVGSPQASQNAQREQQASPAAAAPIRLEEVRATDAVAKSVAGGGAQFTGAAADSTSASPTPLAPGMAQGTANSIAPAMIIRTGQVSVQVKTLADGIVRVRQLAASVGGYVANVQVQSGGEQMHSATLEIKLPASRFDQALAGLAPIGTVESQNVSAQDVSEEFVDVTARTTNAKRLEARLIELLANRTGKLSDVLAVERELARVREEIERYDGRLRYLRTRAAVSTLNVTVHEPPPLVGERGSGNVIVEAFRDAWRNFVGFLATLIASLGVVVPIAVLALVVWLVVRHRIPTRGPTPIVPVRQAEPDEPAQHQPPAA